MFPFLFFSQFVVEQAYTFLCDSEENANVLLIERSSNTN